MSKRQRIIDEVRQKVEEYEDNNQFAQEWNEQAEIYKVRPPSRGSSLHQFSNPRLAEMHRAVNTLATLSYRMMTSQEPMFDIEPTDFISDEIDLQNITATLNLQLQLSSYKEHLLNAITSCILFGTVFVEEPYMAKRMNQQGDFIPVTGFRPRSMLQVAFQRGISHIEDASWVTTSDIVNNAWIRRLTRQDNIGLQDVWIESELNKFLKDRPGDAMSDVDDHIINRLNAAGYNTDAQFNENKEHIIYRGTLDTLNDGIEYKVGLGSRRFLTRFRKSELNVGSGRDLRVARWIPFELEALGLGLGGLFGKSHKFMDANRQKAQDGLTIGNYPMWLKSRFSGITDDDLRIRALQVIETDDMKGLSPVPVDLQGPLAAMQLEQVLKGDFRAATTAVESLQAVVTEATATEASLAQNEAVRAVSVRTELMAEPLARQHLEVMHANNIRHIKEPLNINVNRKPRLIYPISLQKNVNFRIRMVTDKDFKPERLKKMLEAFQIMTSTKNPNQPQDAEIIQALRGEILRLLGVPVRRQDETAQAPSLDATSIAGAQGAVAPNVAPDAPQGITNTPIGPTLSSPGGSEQ